MAIRDTLRANAQPLLRPGETIQAVFGERLYIHKRVHKDMAEPDSLVAA